MKNSQKITRIHLEVSKSEKFFIYGIVSSEPDYKLSLALNKKMGISLKNRTPLNLPDNSGSEASFSRFAYTNHSDDIVYNLISNRSGKQFLIQKLKNIDYIFHVHYPGSDNNSPNVISMLRDTESVNAVFVIDTGTINDKNLHYIIQ
jgi:hypothetical protein